MEEKKETLTRAINFKISAQEDAFLNEVVNELHESSGFKISKANLIRRYCTRAHISMEDPKRFNMIYKDFPLFYRQYNANKITNLKRENLIKKRNGEDIDDNLKVKKVVRVKFSEEDFKRIEALKKYVEEVKEIKVSMSDFVRFCINSERDYIKNMENEINNATKEANSRGTGV
ncbi:MAG TPA: hypothetical protein ACHBZ9_17375 [Arsenophonus nasoniae]|uniref:hypothetical protein n=1 Tax=Arsenophonus nasoniae TaxID=638 RepID=UPI00387A2571